MSKSQCVKEVQGSKMERTMEVQEAKGERQWLLRTALCFISIEFANKTLSVSITTTEQSCFADT